ncbi:hypothetical protein KIPB_003951, partial [Kipferlia bialata]|eukprot:g3951.t1
MSASHPQRHSLHNDVPTKPSQLSILFPDEPLPGSKSSMSYYAQSSSTIRPSMAAYMSQIAKSMPLEDETENEAPEEAKFNWFTGVMGRVLLCVLGVVLFLRLPYIV